MTDGSVSGRRMPNILVKNLPKEVHQLLNERAKRNRRSLNAEILALLEGAVLPRRIDRDDAAQRIRALRARFRGPPLKDADIARARAERRP